MNERITSIDTLRGVALLGILIMNIVSFSMPSTAYFGPLGYEGTSLNQVMYGFGHIFADQKFMALFSMLFGASTIIFVENAQRKGKRATFLFYVRNIWLLVMGYIHSTYIWFGDVLLVYALCSFVLYFFRNIPAKIQLGLGLVIYLAPNVSNTLLHQYVVEELPAQEQQAFVEHWSPSAETLQKELDVFRGSYARQIEYRATMFQSTAATQEVQGEDIYASQLILDIFSRAFGMMLVGMAFFRWGILNNTLSEQSYKKMVVYGMAFGVPIAGMGLILSYSYHWDWTYAQFFGRLPNSLATIGISSAYIGLLMLVIQKGYATTLLKRCTSLGKMALTGYLLQSVIATSIFYGFGLGLFGSLNRLMQWGIVLAIWGFMLFAAPIWLARFRYGPIEWLWRCCTYFRVMPLRYRLSEQEGMTKS